MKTRTALVPLILAATAAIGEPSFADGQPVSAGDLGQHPAVLVAKKWQSRAIDPNTFIVLHPAGLQLLPASPAFRVAAANAGSDQRPK